MFKKFKNRPLVKKIRAHPLFRKYRTMPLESQILFPICTAFGLAVMVAFFLTS